MLHAYVYVYSMLDKNDLSYIELSILDTLLHTHIQFLGALGEQVGPLATYQLKKSTEQKYGTRRKF